MAHAGTPTNLAKQPAASGSMWNLVFNAVVILALGLALAMATSFIITNRAAPAVDTSYNQIEAQRGTANLSGATVDADALAKAAAAKARAMSGVAPENSLDAAVRAAAAKGAVSVDTSYNAIENLRAQSGVTVDTSQNAAEKARGGAFSGTTIDPSTYDRTPRGAHGKLP